MTAPTEATTSDETTKGRALWRFAVRTRWSAPIPDDVGLHLVCPLGGCDWSQRIEAFGPDELGALLRVAFGHLESAHEADE